VHLGPFNIEQFDKGLGVELGNGEGGNVDIILAFVKGMFIVVVGINPIIFNWVSIYNNDYLKNKYYE
jgi:hypothetical protein